MSAVIVSREDAVAFRTVVLDFYAAHGRVFPWRVTRNPWSILVSEIMLQQTQTHRVEPKYTAWMQRFPDAASLARAPVRDVFEAWKGLGYNSRALRLKQTAVACMELYAGQPPADEKLLLELPGIGKYTARAILAFAYGIPSALLETNIRTALIFHFFRGHEKIRDRELEATAEAVLDRSDPRTWYQALMDYGAWLKKMEPDSGRKAAVYAKQSRFEGSVRQARGIILKTLIEKPGMDLAVFAAESGFEYRRLDAAVRGLSRDGLIQIKDGLVRFSGEETTAGKSEAEHPASL